MPPSSGALLCWRRNLAHADWADVRGSTLNSSEAAASNSLVEDGPPVEIVRQPDSSQLVGRSSADPNFPVPPQSKFETSLP
jgi:hypothetical protein